MSKTKTIAAVEVGSTKVVTLVGQINIDDVTFEKTVNIIGAATSEARGIKKGQIVDIEEATESIVASVEAAERMAGSDLSNAYVAIDGAHIKSQNSHGVVAISGNNGEITESDIERVIDAASAISLPSSREVIHVLPREYMVDGETGVKDPIGMTGVRLEVDTHIVTGSSPSIKNIKKAINEVGVNITEMVFSGIASSESCLSSTEKELGCVIIDVGGGTTSIAVFIDGAVCYSGVIPIGAKNVTNDLAIGLRVSLETAEKIKMVLSAKKRANKDEESDDVDLNSLGVTEIKKISKKTLLEGIIKPRLNEIFSMVRLELEKEGLINRIPSGAIITGGGAETVGVAESAKRMLSLPVRIGIPKGVGGLIDGILSPAYATSIGLILYGSKFETEPQNLSKLTKRIKLPTSGIFGKIVSAVRDLLP